MCLKMKKWSTNIKMSTELTDPLRAQIDSWKAMFCPKATDDEMKLFISMANRSGLSPEFRQIYLVGRYNKELGRTVHTPQTSVDGFRASAEMSGHYAGQLGPFFSDDGINWVDCWLKKTPPKVARIGVLRHDWKEPLWQTAIWDSYVQENRDGSTSKFWSDFPEVMLSKCAESLALRRAFPMRLSGLYTREEMSQAIDIEGESEAVKPKALGAKPLALPAASGAKKFNKIQSGARAWLDEKLLQAEIESEFWFYGHDAFDGLEMTKENLEDVIKTVKQTIKFAAPLDAVGESQ